VGEIKSAVELALEKTQDVEADKKTLEAHEHRQAGQKLVSQLLEDPEFDPKKELKKYSGEQLRWVKEGFFKVLLSNISLPESETEMERIKTVRRGCEAILKDKKSLDYLFEQVEQLFSQYLQNRQQLIEQLRQQYEQHMQRQQQQQGNQQLGGQGRDPANDPEFSKALQQNLSQLKDQYGPVVDQVRDQLQQIFDSEK
jgi:phosphoenolpyruvate-protein kinase (PTS system EI component)